MTTAYITKEAGKIRANNNTFLFEGMDGSKTTLFPDKLERMVITGNIGMTGRCIIIGGILVYRCFLYQR